jgi:hypothetical protein
LDFASAHSTLGYGSYIWRHCQTNNKVNNNINIYFGIVALIMLVMLAGEDLLAMNGFF